MGTEDDILKTLRKNAKNPRCIDKEAFDAFVEEESLRWDAYLETIPTGDPLPERPEIPAFDDVDNDGDECFSPQELTTLRKKYRNKANKKIGWEGAEVGNPFTHDAQGK